MATSRLRAAAVDKWPGKFKSTNAAPIQYKELTDSLKKLNAAKTPIVQVKFGVPPGSL